MKHPGLMFAAFLVLALLLAGSAFGIAAACPDGCDPADCNPLCLDCVCCPNGSSTPGEPSLLPPAPQLLPSAAGLAAEVQPDDLAAEILHVPRLRLA